MWTDAFSDGRIGRGVAGRRKVEGGRQKAEGREKAGIVFAAFCLLPSAFSLLIDLCQKFLCFLLVNGSERLVFLHRSVLVAHRDVRDAKIVVSESVV